MRIFEPEKISRLQNQYSERDTIYQELSLKQLPPSLTVGQATVSATAVATSTKKWRAKQYL